MRKHLLSLIIVAICLIGFQSFMFAQTTIYVNSSTGNDAGGGTVGSPYKTFNKGYTMVSNGDILDLTGTFTWTDGLETGDAPTSGYTINKNITIQGQSGSLAIVQAASSSGSANCRVFTVNSAYSVTFNNLEIRYGNPPNPGDGGGMCFEGSPTITISNCYIHHNTSRQGVGVYISPATVSITNSTIANNIGTNAQSGVNGGGIAVQGNLPLTVTNTTICNNYIYGYGGGINSLASNTTTITNCTIVSNTSESDGGGISMGGPAGCAIQIKNTIVANNTSNTVPASADFDLFQGTLTDNGYNIVEVGTGTFTATGDITGNQANLFGTGIATTPSLALNSSINGTPTLALSAGSVAINAGSSVANGSVSIPTTDQRGLSRVGNTDIGAYEYGAAAPNSAPTDVLLSASAVNENVSTNTTIGTLSSTDPDVGNTFTYTLVSGTGSTDNASFNISGSSLRITNSPDYETKSSYSVRVRTTDQGSLFYEKAFTITISDLNEAPTDISLSGSSINENVVANSAVGTLSSTDQDAANTFTYTLVAGTGSTDNASFNISGNNLRITNSPDYETKNSYSVRVRTTDQGGVLYYEKAFTITINNVNETPTDISLSASSINENVVANSTIGTLSSTDPDVGNTFTYTLVVGTGDTDNASFNTSGSSLRITNSPDFEAKSSFSVRVRTTDQGSLTYEEAFTITINDLNETPTNISLSASSINENVIANSTIGTLSSTDPDAVNTFTYTLVAGTGSTDNASFNISGSSLRITGSPDFETKSSYSVRVRTTDQGTLWFEKVFTITITDLNEAPTDISLSGSSISENEAANSTVGTLSSTDQDAANTFTYTLVAGAGSTDNASFNISGSSLRITNSPDFETNSSYSVRVRTTDQGTLFYEKAFTITISNVNETPTDLALSAASINENVVANSTVGPLSTTDPDVGNTFTYTLVTGTGSTDNALFNISGSSLRITNSPDFETKSSYSVRVRSTDQGSLWFEKVFVVTINDLNEAPSGITLSISSIDENVVANSTVGTLSSTDQDAANTFTYTLVAGTGSTDNASFNISGSSLRITGSPDFETKSSYSVRVRTTDQGTLFYEKVFTITINDLNEAPTDISLSGSSINENVVANSAVGTLSSTDQDAANTFTYTLVAGTGSTDNASFNISGNSLRITSSPDFEVKSSYSVRVRTTDQGGVLYYEKTFTITINNVNETPTDITLSANSIDENVAGNSTVGSLSTTDVDAGNTFTYTLVAGTGDTDNASFNISGGNLRITNSPDYETKNSYSVRVRTTDQGSLDYDEAFTITINDLNEAPTNITLSANSIDENVAANSTIGTLSTTDQDAGNTFTYTLVAGAGSSDNSSFNISGNELQIISSPDYETKSSYLVRFRSTDQGSLYFEKSYAISINNVNESPVVTASQSFSLNENSTVGTVVGTVSATDSDAGATFSSWTITVNSNLDGDGTNAFAIDASTGQITVADLGDLDRETNISLTIKVTVSDGTNTSAEESVTINLDDVNDVVPVITASQSFSIDENSVNSIVVGTVLATDPDLGTVFQGWDIIDGNTGNAFAINSTTGAITVSTSTALDYESDHSFSLKIEVSDGLHTVEGFVTVNLNNLNDNAPIIQDATFAIDENSANGTAVGAVAATDADGTLNSLTYSITTGNTNDAFAISSATGAITINKTEEINFEVTPVFNLTVTASDGTLSGNANVRINLNDVVETGIDDNKSFSIKVYPNPAVDEVSVSLDHLSTGSYRIEIFNLIGSKLYQRDVNTPSEVQVIDLTDLAAGIYFVKAYSKQLSLTKRLVV